MKPTVDVYTVALPWYSREDFDRLWELAHDHDDIPRNYEIWHAAAQNVISEWLSRGRALQIVSVKPDEFLAWLAAERLPNTAATRLRYVEAKAAGIGIEETAAGVAIDQPPAPKSDL